MKSSFTRLALLTVVALSVIHLALTSNAQTPPPRKEGELVAAGYKRLSGQEVSALALGKHPVRRLLEQRGWRRARRYHQDLLPERLNSQPLMPKR